ncbi:MAG: hypothetical protein AABZ31_10570 [Bdellovibrionota bacterium]
MSHIDWIKDLVLAEQKMEDSGLIDLSGTDQDRFLEEQTLDYLRDIKTAFIEASSAFNQMKGTSLGTAKIYGISNTKADFMLFRNGFKLIFSMRRGGEIEIYHSLIGSHFLSNPIGDNETLSEKDVLKAQWGAFADLNWNYKNMPVRIDFLVRHYFSRFIRESAK